MPRRPDPIGLKLLKGRAPGRDQAGALVPTPPAFERGMCACPEHFDADARELWQRVTPGLEQLDLLKPEDYGALVAYCETWSTYQQALRCVRADGLTVQNPKTGMPHKNPAQAIVETASMQLLRYAQEFGLTPASENAVAKYASDVDDDDVFGGAS